MKKERHIEVFRTTIKSNSESTRIQLVLKKRFPTLNINFDLEDCDNILRIESNEYPIDTNSIVAVGKECGLLIEPLE